MNTSWASWSSWVRGIQGLSPAEKLIAYELAFLSDTRGVSVAPLEHLERVTCRSRRTVLAALQRLENLGVLRNPEAMPSPFQGLRFQLTQGAPTAGTPPRAAGSMMEIAPAITAAFPITTVDDSDGQSLRDQLSAAWSANWSGKSCWDLAATLEREGPRRFASVISQRRAGGIRDPWDTLTLAWELVRTHCEALIAATEPWALWVHLVRIESHRIDPQTPPPERFEFAGPSEAPQPLDLGIDDFDPHLSGVVWTLVDLGVEEALAWAGTARVLELIGVGESRRHWMAGRDAKLHSLGIGERAGRAWMTLLVGSRRGRAGALTGAAPDTVREQAREVALAMTGWAASDAP